MSEIKNLWSEIENDGLNIITKIHGRLVGDSLGAMAASIGLFLYGMSHAIESYVPDIVLVLGDRSEQLAGAMAAGSIRPVSASMSTTTGVAPVCMIPTIEKIARQLGHELDVWTKRSVDKKASRRGSLFV